jgi:hypothetical protein
MEYISGEEEEGDDEEGEYESLGSEDSEITGNDENDEGQLDDSEDDSSV